MTATVLVTGGSGFVGGAILSALAGSGRVVRALARSDAAAEIVAASGAEPVRGDLHDADSLTDAMRGCGTVFHAAGHNAMCVRDPSPLFRENIDGAGNVVRAAAAAEVRRVVHTSSAATIGESRGTIGREDSPHRGWFLSRYEESKFRGERAVLALGREHGVEVVSVNPSSVQGPGRTRGSARLLLQLLRGRVAVVRTFVSLIDVADCAAGHLLAADHGAPGERYLLNGVTLEATHAVALLRAEAGLPHRAVAVPRAVATLAGGLGDAAGAALRRDVPICRELARTMLHGHRYDGSRASRELGLEYTPIADTIRRTVAWYARAGLLGAHGDAAVADYDEDPARARPDPRHRARRTP